MNHWCYECEIGFVDRSQKQQHVVCKSPTINMQWWKHGVYIKEIECTWNPYFSNQFFTKIKQ
jgi:hypothetical protein